jgi:hypothetical protein
MMRSKTIVDKVSMADRGANDGERNCEENVSVNKVVKPEAGGRELFGKDYTPRHESAILKSIGI